MILSVFPENRQTKCLFSSSERSFLGADDGIRDFQPVAITGLQLEGK
jgi:hypothetical protein